MTLSEFKQILALHPEKNVRFIFPDGDPIEPDFHVTEVGHVVKHFIDCGGTKRSSAACVLQTWVAANDRDHRLSAGKLGSILDLAKSILPAEDLELEIEYEGCVISQYPLSGYKIEGSEVQFMMARKHTDCLDKEACGLLSPSTCGCSPGGCG